MLKMLSEVCHLAVGKFGGLLVNPCVAVLVLTHNTEVLVFKGCLEYLLDTLVGSLPIICLSSEFLCFDIDFKGVCFRDIHYATLDDFPTLTINPLIVA